MKSLLKILLALQLLLVSVFFNSCNYKGVSDPAIIRLKGSDTMLLLARRWAAEYMKSYPDISIYVEGGGSGTGFKALSEGKTDIALASRLINSHEVRLLGRKYGQLGVSFLVAKDGLSVYLNPNNPLSNLSMAQLNNIFTGQIKNWKDVGGLDQKISVVIRPVTSGTHHYFRSHVLENQPYVATATTLPTTRAVTEFVMKHENAIGYGGIAYGRKVKHIRVDNIAATEENVRNYSYPLSRYLYLYTIQKPGGRIKEFIDWTLSQSGQKIVQEVGYIPLWKAD